MSHAAADPATLTISALADRVERAHHSIFRSEMALLLQSAAKVAEVHGAKDPRLLQVPEVLHSLHQVLEAHMMKAERVFLPYLRQLDQPGALPPFPCPSGCGTASGPVGVLTAEHDVATQIMDDLAHLTDGFAVPADACRTHRKLLQGLAHLRCVLEEHVREEQELLFPRGIEAEERKRNR